MIKHEIIVPRGITYISEWKEFRNPEGRVIVDKTVTGCGYTEFCIRNDQNLVLVSPRRILLENKAEQHDKEPNVYYFKNTSEEETKEGVIFSTNFEKVQEMKDDLSQFLTNCYVSSLPCKILVTYDSFHYVRDVLGEKGLANFQIVVDEFQSIFMDAHFKPSVELDLINDLSIFRNVLFLSATPMLDQYLDKLPEFADLLVYTMKWPPDYIEQILVKERNVRSISAEAKKIVKLYKEGRFDVKMGLNGETVQSKEAVLYVNSVTLIIDIINKCHLQPEEVNILCSNNKDNKRLLNKKLRIDGHKIGKIPLKGAPHKMFTICTKTTYLGADFYSTCASSYIFSDANIRSLMVDVVLDLPQIAGRQRLRENVFKNEITIFYNTIRDKELQLTEENFERTMKEKFYNSYSIINSINIIPSAEDRRIMTLKLSRDKIPYEVDFLGRLRSTGELVINELVAISEQRAWDVKNSQYLTTSCFVNTLQDVGGQIQRANLPKLDPYIQGFIDTLNKNEIIGFSDKLQAYCSFRESILNSPAVTSDHLVLINKGIDNYLGEEMSLYYDIIGISGLKNMNFQKKPIIKEMINYSNRETLKNEVYYRFISGNRYSSKEIIEFFKEKYSDLKITTSTKASNLEMYYDITSTSWRDNGVIVRGYIVGDKK